MASRKPEESARDAARDAILLKKLKGYLQSEDLYKKVSHLFDMNGRCRHGYTAFTNENGVLNIKPIKIEICR